MNRNRMLGAVPNFLAVAVLSCIILGAMASFSDVALSAESPVISGLEFYYTNEKGDRIPLAMTTAAEAEGIALDSKGFLYVTDPSMNAVSVFNSNARLVKRITSVVRVPVGVSVGEDAENTTIYVGGYSPTYSNGFRVFKLGLDGNLNGSLGGDLLTGLFNDISAGKNGEVYVSLRGDSTVKMINREGAIVGTFGRFSERKDVDVISGVTRYRTMHTMASLSGIALDDAKGELYVSTQEIVSYLNKTCSSGTCYTDADAYGYYANTGPEYMYWEPLVDRYCVLVIDLAGGGIKRVIDISGGFASSGSTSSSSYLPKGLALDNKGRLYIATTSGIMVYDSVTGIATAVSGSFAPGMYSDLVYAQDSVGLGGRLYATAGNKVYAYSIDSGAKPANTAPTSAGLLSPFNGAYAGSKSPDLKIANASDKEADPLLYGYEIRDGNGTAIPSPTLTPEGLNGETLMAVSSILTENTVYRWRSQSFDGNLSTWSAGDWETDKNNWAEFCVNVQNDNPESPVLTNPVSGAFVSPFSSYLVWSPSKDPDCYDTVSYKVEISNDPYFGSLLSSRTVGNQSIKLGDMTTALVNGSTYYWRVKAVDNNGGESGYSAGSFTYKTTVVSFSSDRPDTKVYIDGNYAYRGKLLGAAPLEVQNITPGSHFVTFEKAGYEPYYTVVNVTDGDDVVSVPQAIMIAASKIRPSAAGTGLGSVEFGNASPFIVDYNSDSLKDIIAGSADGKMYLFLSERQIIDGVERVVLAASGVVQADGSDLHIGSRSAPFVVDYNNDGKKDIVTGSGDGRVYLFLNNGSESAPTFTAAGVVKDSAGNEIIVASNSTPALIDYNNDGNKDMVVGSGEGVLRLYINAGSDSSPVFDQAFTTIEADGVAINVGSNSKPFFTDWNSDGKPDLLIGGGSLLRLYINDGSSDSPHYANSVDITGVVGETGDVSPFVVDWSWSSARDIVVGSSAGTIVSYASACGGFNPDNIPPTAPALTDPLNAISISSPVLLVANAGDVEGCPVTYGYEVRDVNGVTVASGSGIAEGADGKTSMTINGLLAENTTYYWRAAANDGDAANGTTWSDWTGSFFFNQNNDAPGVPTAIAPVNNAPASIYGTSFGWSISKDADIYDTVSYFIEISAAQSFEPVIASGRLSGASIRLADLTNALTNNTVYYWRVQAIDNSGDSSGYGMGSFIYKTTVISFTSDQADTKVYIDGDAGNLGGFIGTAPITLENISIGSHVINFVKEGYETYSVVVNVVDPLIDGTVVMVPALMTPSVKIELPVVTGSAIFMSNQAGTRVYIDGNYGYFGRFVGVAPIQVDGLVLGSHFVTFVKDGYEPYHAIVNVKEPLVEDDAVTVSAVMAKAPKIRPSVSGAELLRTSGNSTPFVIDYNNDGLKDIMAGDANGNIYLYLSELQQDGSTNLVLKEGALQNINVGSRAVPFVVDYNNDGKKDLLVGSGGGQIYLYMNTGDDVAPLFTSAETIKDSSGSDIRVSNSAPVVVDYNNDGKKDLVVGGADGALRLYLNISSDASPEFGAPTLIKVDNADLCVGVNLNSKVFFTDWNSDGKKDMVVGGNTTLQLFLNVGTDAAPDFKSIAALQDWIKDKKRERGNREFIPYLGYNHDIGDLTGGNGDASPFVVDWAGTSGRDVIVGSGGGSVSLYMNEE